MKLATQPPLEDPLRARRWSLAPHVRACLSDGQVILLDLRRNRYLGIGGRHLPALADAVEGWPAGSPAQAAPVTPADLDGLARRLAEQGLLTTEPSAPRTHMSPDEALASMNALDAVPHPAIGVRRVLRVLAATVTAAWQLRFKSLHGVADAVETRRRQRGRAVRAHDPEAMRDAVAAFEFLRPLAFTARDKCLYDSLALVHFLASEGLFPRWVVGVKTLPFGAHSWVQDGSMVLNDQHELVRRFQPILVV